MDPLIVLLMVILVVLTVLLVVVGVQVIIILKDLRVTLAHLNKTLENTDNVVEMLNKSFTNIGNTMAGLKSGLKLIDIFFTWLKEHQQKDDLNQLP